jgi:hypothetical protein
VEDSKGKWLERGGIKNKEKLNLSPTRLAKS